VKGKGRPSLYGVTGREKKMIELEAAAVMDQQQPLLPSRAEDSEPVLIPRCVGTVGAWFLLCAEVLL